MVLISALALVQQQIITTLPVEEWAIAIPIIAYGKIHNDIYCNHYLMSGQDDAIPLQAVEPNDSECVFEPNVIKCVNNFVWWVVGISIRYNTVI